MIRRIRKVRSSLLCKRIFFGMCAKKLTRPVSFLFSPDRGGDTSRGGTPYRNGIYHGIAIKSLTDRSDFDIILFKKEKGETV